MNRFKEMTSLLDQKKLFKFICGAGNEEAEEVKKLTFIYTLAGAKCFDVSANLDVVKHAVLGIQEATDYANKLGRTISMRPFINVSIGMKGDPHVRKAVITDKCVRCGACRIECSREAITEDFEVVEARCIGCGGCEAVCRNGAIRFYHKDRNIRNLLEDCKAAGMEQIELHAAVHCDDMILDEWQMVNEVVSDNYVSMCLDRLHLGNSQLKRRIQKAKQIAKERFIVQADGVPMSGGKDDFNTTLQAVAIADIVMKEKLDVKVLLSGGTNSLSTKLADMCGVAYHGVSIGTFARNLVKGFVKEKDFMSDDARIKQTVDVAYKLVVDSIGEPIW